MTVEVGRGKVEGESEVDADSTGTGEMGFEELKDVMGDACTASEAADEKFCPAGESESFSDDEEDEDVSSSEAGDNSFWEGDGDHLGSLFDEGGDNTFTLESAFDFDWDSVAPIPAVGISNRPALKDFVRGEETRDNHRPKPCSPVAQDIMGGPGPWKPSDSTSNIFSRMHVTFIPLKKNLTLARPLKKVASGRLGTVRRTGGDRDFVGLCYRRRKASSGKGITVSE